MALFASEKMLSGIADVEKSGKGDYVPFTPTAQQQAQQISKYGESFSGMSAALHNVKAWRPLDVPVGKALAAVSDSLWMLGTTAEVTERAIGNYITAPSLRKELGVDNPQKERAFQAALGVSYSGLATGGDAMRAAYKEALAAEEAGQLDFDKAQEIGAKHSVWWAELGGQLILDPLNLLSAAPKGVKTAMTARAAEGLFWTPRIAKDTKALESTAKIAEELAGLATRGGQIREAESIIDKGLAFIAPRLKRAVASRTSERVEQVGLMMLGTEQRRAALEVSQEMERAAAAGLEVLAKDSPEYGARVAEAYANRIMRVAEQWVKLASDKPEDLVDAATNLRGLGYGTLPTSTYGRRYALVLKEVAGKADGGVGDLTQILQKAKGSKAGAVEAAAMWHRKVAQSIDTSIGAPKLLEGGVVGAFESYHKWQPKVAAEEVLTTLFMGLNPGYAMRNMYGNVTKGVIDGWSPFYFKGDPLKDWMQVVGANRGIGSAGEKAGSWMRPFQKLAESFEEVASHQYAAQARWGAIAKLWKRGVKELPPVPAGTPKDVAEHLEKVVKQIGYHTPEEIDRLEAELVSYLKRGAQGAASVPPADALPSLFDDTWRVMPDDIVEGLQRTGDGVWLEANSILREAKSPGEAIGKLQNVIAEYGKHLKKLAAEPQNLGPVKDSLTGEGIWHILQTDEFGTKEIAKLSESLGQKEGLLLSRQANMIADAAEQGRDLKVVMGEIEGIRQGVRQEQLLLYSEFLTGNISKAEYTKALDTLYDSTLKMPTSWVTHPKTNQRIYLFGEGLEKGEMPWEAFEQFARSRLAVTPGADLNPTGVQALRGAEHILENGLPELAMGVNLTEMSTHGVVDVVNNITKLTEGLKEAGKAGSPIKQLTRLAVPVEDVTAWTEYFTKLKDIHTKTHIISTEVARRARDSALLDYRDRRTFDPIIKTVFPWAYWHTRSLPNTITGMFLNPQATANYMKIKKTMWDYNDQNPDLPTWARDTIVLNPPGFEGTIYANLEASFNPIQSMFDGFDDPEKEKDAFGQLISNLGGLGPAPHPLLAMAYAAERAFIEGDSEGARSLGYLSPVTRTTAALTGVVVEPWLWAEGPGGGKKIPWSGGTSYDMTKATRLLGYKQGEGEYSEEQAVLAAATRNTDVFAEVMRETLSLRKLPALGSFIFGVRLTPRYEWEEKIDTANREWQLAKSLGPEQASAYLAEKPWLTTVWLSRDNETARLSSLAKNVFARIPPGIDRKALLEKVGLPQTMVDAFYEGKSEESDDNGISKWDESDYRQFVNGVINMAEVLGVPDKETAKEWRAARDARAAVFTEEQKLFPQAQEQAEMYHRIMQAQGEDKAKEYGKSSGYYEYLDWKKQRLLQDPMLIKYYVEPTDVDSAVKSLTWDTLEANYPGYHAANAAYNAIPDSDKAAKRQFRLAHPGMVEGWKAATQIEEATRKALRDERELASTGQPAPGVVDFLVSGTPNIMQRELLTLIEDMGYEAELRPPEPEGRKGLDPTITDRMNRSDAVYAKVYEAFPGMVAQEKIYAKIKEQYGEESANLYAKQFGLFNAWDAVKLLKIQDPVLLQQMGAEELAKAGTAVARQEKEKLFPRIDDIQAQYYALPKGKARSNFLKQNPVLKQYWDWDFKGKAAAYGMMMMQRRDAAKFPINQQGQPAPATQPGQDIQ